MNAKRIRCMRPLFVWVVVAGLLVGLGAGTAPVRAGDEVGRAERPAPRVVEPQDAIRDEPLAAPPLSPQLGVSAQSIHYEPWFSYRNVTGQTLDRLDLYVAIPPDRDNQTLTQFSFSDPYELLVDRYGLQAAHFRWSDIAPDQVVEVTWEWTAQLSTLEYTIDPSEVGDLDDIPADIRALYTENGHKYSLESPIIQEAAKLAVQGAGSLYERAYSIYQFVSQHLKYIQDGRWDDAETVYRQQSGSCTEHTWLYIALCRANGIPARYVGGMASMSSNHRWAEVYLPPYGWVPVDPTWETFGVAPGGVLVTTVGGGGSEYLDWTYNWLHWENRPDVFVSPLEQAAGGAPGAWVDHTIDVHNETGVADRFDLSFSGSSWETELSHANTGELASGASFRMTARTRVPDAPAGGDRDTATIHAVSSSDPGSKAGSATVTTIADVPPLIEVSPAALDSTQAPGSSVVKELTLYNPGVDPLIFNVRQAQPLHADLLLSLDETGAAEFFLDGSGQGSHATCSGSSCPQAGVWSPRGKAALFDGIEDRIVTPLQLDQSASSRGATMAAWVFPTSAGAGLHHVLSTDDGGHDWSIVHEDGMWAFFDGEGKSITSFSVDLNRWQHVAAVFRPGQGVAFYKNGQDEHFHTLGYDESSNPVVLGDNAGPWAEHFQGKIDEVQVYRFPFTPLQMYYLAQEPGKVDWLSWDLFYGRVQSLETRTIRLTLDASGLSPDTYTAQVAVISDDPNVSRINVPVTMNLFDENWDEVPCDVERLIAAIQTANANGMPDTLDLAAGCTYTLVETDNETDGPNGLPSITSSITINGHGATIERRLPAEDEWPIQDPFRIFHVAAGGTLTLNQLTVRQGRGVIGADLPGGYGIANRGTLTLVESTLSGNRDQQDSAGCGGGLYNFPGGLVTLVNSRVTDNGVDRHSSGGGGLCNDGDMTLIGSTVRDNHGPSGGGIVNHGTLEIATSTVFGNAAWAFYDAMAGSGGGIENSGALTLRSSTVSGNDTFDSGGGISNSGTVTLTNSTVTGNSVDQESNGCSGVCGGAITLQNTIVAAQGHGADCEGTIASQGYNLDGDGTCALDQPTDQPNTDPLLGPLQDNGGPTETHTLLDGSPAVDQGYCPQTFADQRGLPRHVDAPGVTNAALDGCDVGAVEAQTGAPLGVAAGAVTSAASGEPLSATLALLPTALTTVSDPESGEYELWWATGSYTLQVTAAGYLTETAAVELDALAPSTLDFVLDLVSPDVFRLFMPIVMRP